MAFGHFTDTMKVKAIATAEEVDLGSFDTDEHLELGHIRLQFYKQGAQAGAEQVRINVYSSSSRTGLIYRSDWLSLADIPTPGTYWLGWLRFDFSREFVNKNSTYYLSLETSGYTRNDDTFYLGIPLDWHGDGYASSGSLSPRFEVYGYV